MGGQPCRLKLLMDGARLQAATKVLRANLPFAELTDEQAYEIITYLNDAEDAVDKATASLLTSQGYNGPLPHSLTFEAYKE